MCVCVNVNLKLLVFVRPLQQITSAAPEAFSCQCVDGRYACILNPSDMCVFSIRACILNPRVHPRDMCVFSVRLGSVC